MQAFFTKKQKKLMRERKRKHKLAFSSSPSDDTKKQRPPPPKQIKSDVSSSATKGNNLVRKQQPPASQPAPKTVIASSAIPTKRPRTAAATASPNSSWKGPTPTTAKDGSAGGVSDGRRTVQIPDNLSAKDAKKFRKEERRKARQDGVLDDVVFVTTTTSDTHHDDDHPSNDNDEPNDNDTKRRKLHHNNSNSKKVFPRINDLVQQAKEQQALDAKRQVALAEEEQLTEANKQRYVALDCEMVGIGTDGKKSALARVSVVDWDGRVLLDTFVQVPSRVVDFRTQYSGIKPKHIQAHSASQAQKPEQVREQVAALVKDKILVGHALHNDLSVLMLQHPKTDIRDTAKYQPFQRYHLKWRPRKLRDLVKEHLGKTIQDGSHDSTIDAACTMELFRTVRQEWEHELSEKTAKPRKGGGANSRQR